MGWLSDHLRIHPQPSVDYRVFDMAKMNGWGNNAHFWPQGQTDKAMIIATPGPRLGDVVTCPSQSGLGLAFIIVDVRRQHDPGDQYFVDLIRWGRPSDLPPSALDNQSDVW